MKSKVKASTGVMMTGVYRSGTEYALQLLQGSREINTSMYYINAFRYIKDKKYKFNELEDIIVNLESYTKKRYNIHIPIEDVINHLKNSKKNNLYTRSDIYHSIMHTLYLKNEDKDTWIEKTQLNWTKTNEFIKETNNRKVILIYRDPRSVLASFKKYTNAPKPAYLGAIFNSLSFFQTLSALKSINHLNQKIYHTSYEKIIEDPITYRKEVYRFLNKKYTEIRKSNWKDYDGKRWVANTTQDKKTMINNPKSMVNSWKQRLTDEEICLCESILGIYMNIYNYKLSNIKYNLDKILDEIKNHSNTYRMYVKYLTSGAGTESFPSDPLDSSTWE